MGGVRWGRGAYSTTDPEARTGGTCLSWCKDGPAPGPRLQARPSVGTGRPGRTSRPSRRARNGAEARTCHAMPRHSVVARSRIAFYMKIFLEISPVEDANSADSWRSAYAGGQPGRMFHGTGGQSDTRPYLHGRTCPASTHLWLWQTLQSPRLRLQPKRKQADVSRTRPPPLAAPGGTGGGHRAGGRVGSAAGAMPCRWRRRSGRRLQHRGLRGN